MRILLAIARFDYGKVERRDRYKYTSWHGLLGALGSEVEVFDTFAPGSAGDPWGHRQSLTISCRAAAT